MAKPDGTDPRAARAQRQAVLAAACLGSFLTPFLSSSLNVALPALGRELNATPLEISWIVTAFLVASAAGLVPFGQLADRLGRREVFLAGAWAQAIALLGAAFAGSAAALIGWRIVQGAGGALIFATATAMLASEFPAGERGRALGLATGAVYLGLALGPVAGGALVEAVGWRAIFVTSVALALALVALLLFRIPKRPVPAAGRPFDLAGALLYALSLAALVGGAATTRALLGARWAIAAGALGFLTFVARERARRGSLADPRLFGRPAFVFANLAALLNYSATFPLAFLLALDLQLVRGLSASRAGLVLLAQPIIMALLSPLAGRLSDRLAAHRVASIGMALTAAGLLLLAGIERATPVGAIVAALFAVGAGFGLFSSPNTNAVLGATPPDRHGVAAAVLGTMRLLGQALSMALVGAIFVAHLGERPLGPASVAAFVEVERLAFALFAIFCALGVAASLARGGDRAAPAAVPK